MSTVPTHQLERVLWEVASLRSQLQTEQLAHNQWLRAVSEAEASQDAKRSEGSSHVERPQHGFDMGLAGQSSLLDDLHERVASLEGQRSAALAAVEAASREHQRQLADHESRTEGMLKHLRRLANERATCMTRLADVHRATQDCDELEKQREEHFKSRVGHVLSMPLLPSESEPLPQAASTSTVLTSVAQPPASSGSAPPMSLERRLHDAKRRLESLTSESDSLRSELHRLSDTSAAAVHFVLSDEGQKQLDELHRLRESMRLAAEIEGGRVRALRGEYDLILSTRDRLRADVAALEAGSRSQYVDARGIGGGGNALELSRRANLLHQHEILRTKLLRVNIKSDALKKRLEVLSQSRRQLPPQVAAAASEKQRVSSEHAARMQRLSAELDSHLLVFRSLHQRVEEAKRERDALIGKELGLETDMAFMKKDLERISALHGKFREAAASFAA